MKVRNVHEMELPVPIQRVGALIDSLGSSEDALWPVNDWPRMRFDGPLRAGARGGHGPIRYVVEDYRPGKSVRFRFTGPGGFDGFHCYEVSTLSAGTTLLRHSLEMTARGSAVLSWPFAFEPLHDALMEDSLSFAQASLGLTPQARQWSIRVRFLRWLVSGGRARRASRSDGARLL